jgi:cohesin complex subunit SA-1/2
MNPSAALQSTVEDLLESLSHTPDAAFAELINCVLRACGCNHTLDPDEVADLDNAPSKLDDVIEAMKQDESAIYPLTSKLPAFKPFRSSLQEFIFRLISSAAPLGQLYTTDLVTTIETWIATMSSSQLRSFRHTATVVAMDIITALSDVAAVVEKEAEVLSRQKEGERKRRKGRGQPATAREKELESKAEEVRDHRAKIKEHLNEFFNGYLSMLSYPNADSCYFCRIFMNRYRDLDPNIRAECVRALGLWFSKYPGYFLEGSYLRYVGWVLSDPVTHVRLEAVKALSLAYAQTQQNGIGALQNFTERFKPRLVEMAMNDTELSVRVAVVQVLQAIDEHGLLEDEQREKLCLLVFDEESKIRKAVGGFVKGVWQETVDERLVGRKPMEKDKKRAGIKAFATLLVQWGRALDKGKGARDDEDMDPDTDQSEGSSKYARRKEIASLVGPEQKGRTALAVEALWDEVEPVKDWDALLDILLLDHSAGEGGRTQSGKGRRGQHTADDSGVDEIWRLEEVDEGVLLDVLVATLRRAKAEAAGGKKVCDHCAYAPSHIC